MREWLAASLIAALVGCATERPGTRGDGGSAPVSGDATAFVRGQSQRVQALGDFASRGSAELRWKDEQGSHFEQAQVELAWRDAGARMALRADKVGERLAWAGADAQRWWIFEIKREPSRLTTGRRGTVPADSMLPFAGPESVMELMAARAWPATASAGAEEDGARWIEWKLPQPVGAWSASRALVPSPGALPRRVELLDATRSVLAAATLSRPLSVQVAGLPTGALPEVAGTMRFTSGNQGATWDIFWDAPGTDPQRLKDRLFDLSVLREALRPQEVVDQDASSR